MLNTVRDPSVRPNDQVFLEFGRYEVEQDGFGGFEPIRCVFDGRYKLTINLLTSDELYDVQADPYEMKNLIEDAEHAKARDSLHDRLIAWMNETRDPFRGLYWHRRPWRKDAPAPTWHYTGVYRQRPIEPGETSLLSYDTGLEPDRS